MAKRIKINSGKRVIKMNKVITLVEYFDSRYENVAKRVYTCNDILNSYYKRVLKR